MSDEIALAAVFVMCAAIVWVFTRTDAMSRKAHATAIAADLQTIEEKRGSQSASAILSSLYRNRQSPETMDVILPYREMVETAWRGDRPEEGYEQLLDELVNTLERTYRSCTGRQYAAT